MRSFFNKTAKISRPVYTNNKSSLVFVADIRCLLKPMSEEKSALNNVQYGKGFKLTTEVAADIKAGDMVSISGIDYMVKGVAVHDNGSEPFKTANLTLGQN